MHEFTKVRNDEKMPRKRYLYCLCSFVQHFKPSTVMRCSEAHLVALSGCRMVVFSMPLNPGN
jgi:hypothetical protein